MPRQWRPHTPRAPVTSAAAGVWLSSKRRDCGGRSGGARRRRGAWSRWERSTVAISPNLTSTSSHLTSPHLASPYLTHLTLPLQVREDHERHLDEREEEWAMALAAERAEYREALRREREKLSDDLDEKVCFAKPSQAEPS